MSTNASLTVDVDHDTNEKGPTTLSTKATEPSDTPCNTPNASATNENYSFQTPANATRKDWDAILISPTGLTKYDCAMKRLQDDKMTEQRFYKDGTPRLRACVQYVYGRELYDELSSQDRIEKICNLVQTKSALERLCSIVFSHPNDTLIVNDGQVNAYVHMALTIDLFCNCEKRGLKTAKFRLRGGFPHKPFMFLQKGRNCFHPATVLFVSLYQQHVHGYSSILDAAQVARRYLFHNPELLEKRVVHGSGSSTAMFAQTDTQCPAGLGHWTVIRCEDEMLDYLPATLCRHVCHNKVGLVTGFKIEPPFQNAARMNSKYQKERHLGYVFFDGGDPKHTQGEWVSYEHEHTKNQEILKTLSSRDRARVRKNTKDLQQMEGEIRNDLKTQNSTGIERLEELNKALRRVLGTDDSQDGSNLFDGNEESSDSPTSQTSSTHAMVLVAYEENIDTGKVVFLLCNPWKSMPLVGMSAAYLHACKAKIHFLTTVPILDDNLDWNSETRIVDCVSCDVEGGDETNPEGWIHDAFGLTFPPTESFHLLYEGFLTW